MTYQHTTIATYTVPETGLPEEVISHIVNAAKAYQRAVERTSAEGTLYISIPDPKCSLKGFEATQRHNYAKLAPGSEFEIRSTRDTTPLENLVEALKNGLENDDKKSA